jgi:hypothetical protein
MSERNAARNKSNGGLLTVLQLPLGIRIVESAAWGFVAISGLFVASLPSVFAVVSGVLLLMLGGMISVRAARARIVLSRDVLVVYGYLCTRYIPREQVKSLERFPTIDVMRTGDLSQITCVMFLGKNQVRLRSEALRARSIITDWAGGV